MGLRVQAEVGYPIRIADARGAAEGTVYVHDLAIDRPAGQKRLDARFEKAFEAIWARETENDRFNSLVVALGTDWRSAALLRTLSRYRSQSGLDPSEPVQVRALAEHPEISNNLLKLFAIKFDPAAKGDISTRAQGRSARDRGDREAARRRRHAGCRPRTAPAAGAGEIAAADELSTCTMRRASRFAISR